MKWTYGDVLTYKGIDDYWMVLRVDETNDFTLMVCLVPGDANMIDPGDITEWTHDGDWELADA